MRAALSLAIAGVFALLFSAQAQAQTYTFTADLHGGNEVPGVVTGACDQEQTGEQDAQDRGRSHASPILLASRQTPRRALRFRDQVPVKSGFRFSKKAVIASVRSLEIR